MVVQWTIVFGRQAKSAAISRAYMVVFVRVFSVEQSAAAIAFPENANKLNDQTAIAATV
jgi:hypothetical protein